MSRDVVIDRAFAIARRIREMALSVQPIDELRAADSIARMYDVFASAPPPEILLFSSPHAAWDRYSEWLPRIGGCTTPWGAAVEPVFPTTHEIASLVGVRGDVRSTSSDVRAVFESILPFDVFFEMSWCAPAGLMDAIFDVVVASDPRSPFGAEDYVTLGPVLSALQKVARDHLLAGGSRSDTHAGAIEAMLQQCSYAMAFDSLVVLVDRPLQIDLREGDADLRFRDGSSLRVTAPPGQTRRPGRPDPG